MATGSNMENEEDNSDARSSTGVLSVAWSVVRWLIPAAAIGYLWREGLISGEHLSLSGNAIWALPAAALCIVLSTLIVSVRFHALLRCLDCPSTLERQVRLNFAGVLAQQFGSEVGYDAVRIAGVRAMGGKGTDILAALMTDRMLGIVALGGLAAAGLVTYWDGRNWLLPALALGAVLVATPLFFILCRRAERGAGTESRLARTPGFSFVMATGTNLGVYRRHGALLAGLLAFSGLSHLLTFVGLYCCGISLVGTSLAPSEALVGGALSAFTGALPLPLAGLGVGEVAFGAVVEHMRGGGDTVEFASVFLINRMALLSVGVVSWIWMSLSKDKIFGR